MSYRKLSIVFSVLLLALMSGVVSAQVGADPKLEQRRHALADGEAKEPFKVFDNLYFIGIEYVSSWILTTSDGLIMFDALFEHEEYGEYLLDNMRKLGFDPADLKYIIITQGHLDHYGQARMLQDLTGAVVATGLGDWGLMKERMGDAGPRRDMVIEDGDSLTLGDTTISFEITPGHTPGTVSTVIPLKDGERTHLTYFHGGTELEYFEPAIVQGFIDDMERIKTIEGIEVQTNNHAFIDDLFIRQELLSQREPGDVHPFVDAEAFDAWVDRRIDIAQELLDCVLADEGPCQSRNLGGAIPSSGDVE
jgi:metallo-beta-lactamase class B